MQQKERLDVLLVERGLAESREKAKAAIMAGRGFVKKKSGGKGGTESFAGAAKTGEGEPTLSLG